MKLTFNVTKENKKTFAKDIAAITGEKAAYQFTPTYAFAIGDMTVNRDATLTAPDGKDLSALLEALKEKGYKLADSEITEAEDYGLPGSTCPDFGKHYSGHKGSNPYNDFKHQSRCKFIIRRVVSVG